MVQVKLQEQTPVKIQILRGDQGDAIIRVPGKKLIVLKKLPYEVALQIKHILEEHLHVLLHYAIEKPSFYIVLDADMVLLRELPFELAIQVEKLLEQHFLKTTELVEEDVEDETTDEDSEVKEGQVIEIVADGYGSPSACIKIISL